MRRAQVGATVCGQGIPSRIHSDLGFAVIAPMRSWAQLGGFGNDFQRLHAFQSLVTQFVPAGVIAVGILCDVRLRRVQGKVRRVVGEVQKPGPRRSRRGSLDEIQGVISDRIGGIEFTLGILTCLSVGW